MEAEGALEPDNGYIFCVSGALDTQSAYETAEGGVCTRAFISSYQPNVTPAEARGYPPA